MSGEIISLDAHQRKRTNAHPGPRLERRDLEEAVREVIRDLRNMPGSTPYGEYLALQELGDRLDRLWRLSRAPHEASVVPNRDGSAGLSPTAFNTRRNGIVAKRRCPLKACITPYRIIGIGIAH